VLGVRGLALDDAGRHQASIAAFASSAELARDGGQQRQRAWSLFTWARTDLKFGDYAAAAPLGRVRGTRPNRRGGDDHPTRGV
jgi:hypothetical protein